MSLSRSSLMEGFLAVSVQPFVQEAGKLATVGGEREIC